MEVIITTTPFVILEIPLCTLIESLTRGTLHVKKKKYAFVRLISLQFF